MVNLTDFVAVVDVTKKSGLVIVVNVVKKTELVVLLAVALVLKNHCSKMTVVVNVVKKTAFGIEVNELKFPITNLPYALR